MGRFGNIDADPLFAGDYSLQDTIFFGTYLTSPCIDTGNPNLWYQDLDGTASDMGATGGLFVLPNFISHDFGEVGDIGSSVQFTLYNYRQTPITISSVSFETASFTTDASFPMTIAPLETGIINIEANNASFENVEDAMEIASDDLPEGLSVSLSITGTEGNVLTGNLSGTYPAATYRISGNLTIADGDTAYLQAGTTFLFDGEYNFNIYGTLKAIGTETDSIVFDNYGDNRWSGFTLDGATDATEFSYVRISGADKEYYGGGMYIDGSNPRLTHVAITDNTANDGGGMALFGSNPTLIHVTIAGNTADFGGGMALSNQSSPTLTNSIIWNNSGSPESIFIAQFVFPVITYSDIEGGWEGLGNIDADPLFTDPNNGDYSLQDGSPCIDAGTADTDGDGVDDITDYAGSAPDMGAYEFGEISEIMAGDTNFDGIVDILDIVRIVNQIMGSSEFNDDEFTAADYNSDGIVDILDIVQIVNYILL